MAYACSEIVNGVCAVWVEVSLPATTVLTPENGAKAFAAGFGIVFSGWGIGFAVSQVKKLIRTL